MNSASPRFSAVIPVCNAEAWLRQCLDSLLAQTEGGWEAVCVDDGSTDGSGAVLAEYAARDERFRVLRQENRGTHVARQAGVAAAEGSWCLFLDPDDWLADDALARLSAILDRTAADVVSYGSYIHATKSGMESLVAALDRQFNPQPRVYDRDAFLEAVFVAHDVTGHLIG
ncbi:MAG: glycosyltransferase family 2 protein, partial [Kiritimatiellae bacterium]|nr:glycosyltransferase family 2 protein [Kiritimatiellia bacterium]